MSWYGQNKEDEIVWNYFGEDPGTLLDLGANDGRTFSNSLRLIQKGWKAVLVEASKEAYTRCSSEHEGNDNVQVINIGIADRVGKLVFHESGEHIGSGDHSLVSTFDSRELKRWENNVNFVKDTIDVVDYKTLLDQAKFKQFDFITMDIEGMESVVLPQMDLSGVRCLCIEYNMNGDLLKYYTKIANNAGLKEIHRNMENVIYAR